MELAQPLLKSFDRMSCGAVVLDASGTVLECNAHADRLLKAELHNGQNGDATDWSRTALKKLLSRAGERFRVDQEAWITVSNSDGAPLVLHAIPVGNGGLAGAHTVLVFVDLSHRPRPTVAVLQRLFDLTPAEARLAIALGAGRTLAEVSEETGQSNATLRSQLSAIFVKTQTHRQPELVALLARVAILP